MKYANLGLLPLSSIPKIKIPLPCFSIFRISSKQINGNPGFTLVEMLVIIILIGILSAITAPSWLSLLKRQRLNTAQAETLSIMREAQARAKREKRVWQASFRKTNDLVQWSIHTDNESENNWIWNNLIGGTI